ADSFGGKRFNAPNDLIVDQTGGIYFTDPLFRAPQPLPQTVQTVYYRSADGNVTRVIDGDLPAPNGIALSSDKKTLYVIPSKSEEMLAYPTTAPGRVGKPRVFCRLKQPQGQSGTGGDGMVIDQRGNLYITTQIGVQMFSPAGKPLGNVAFPQVPANVTFGGPDKKTMFVTARTTLYSIRMPIAGQ
ncbi:MAG: SMP-30/gluconolactonase/LRE family protein, partial [Planctomycetota bacterium]